MRHQTMLTGRIGLTGPDRDVPTLRTECRSMSSLNRRACATPHVRADLLTASGRVRGFVTRPAQARPNPESSAHLCPWRGEALVPGS
ncbi:hypothetical protein EV651_102459 [Kribbella sp. VKM Ac-2571]|nr:hypothetical protein EV651_102459 [Kribbella sp. VKM Ac-2571]